MSRPVSRSRSAVVSAGLSVLFIVVYGGCNWITAHRAHVGSLYFEWERALPFIPWAIPAYMSLDLFFIGAPFLCQTREELRTFSSRIATAILVAGICFLIFPLRFAFERPEANGLTGAVFNWFREIDAPYNLCPSLHAALLLLVADIYIRHLRGGLRIAAIAWFVLIGFSPVFTYQHHLVDVISGFGLAAGCLYFFPGNIGSRSISTNKRIGFYYGLGAITLVVFAIIIGRWGALLLWPGIALGIVAFAYFGGGPNVFRKREGRLPWSTRVVLAPCLAGQQLSLLHYRRQCRPWDSVTPHVWIGSKPTGVEAKKAVNGGVRAVLDLTAEFTAPKAFVDLAYCNIPVLDLTAPTQAQLRDMANFIESHAEAGVVYVHCKIGYSRSAAAVAAYLLVSSKANNSREAFEVIRRARPSLVVRPEIVSALQQFEAENDRTPARNPAFLLASTDRVLA